MTHRLEIAAVAAVAALLLGRRRVQERGGEHGAQSGGVVRGDQRHRLAAEDLQQEVVLQVPVEALTY